jgi:nucleoside-diphosphate-sugar epimerase
MTLTGSRIVVTGATGQVALPVARALAAENDVTAVARFKDAAKRSVLDAAGVRCVSADLTSGDFSDVPADVDYVLNFAVVKSGKWDLDLAGNAEAAALLLAHCRTSRAFFHCSSTGVYDATDGLAQLESSPLGDNHRVMMPTYSISKIAAEAAVRAACRMHDVPTTIARLCVPYGDDGGWPAFHLALIEAGAPVPVRPNRTSVYNPIHDDDIIATLPALVGAASVPATIVNWGGDEEVSIDEWSSYLGELAGRDVRFDVTEQTITGIRTDNTKRRAIAGATHVHWRDGFKRMFDAHAGS